MTAVEQRCRVVGSLLSDMFTIYNRDNDFGICWKDTDRAVTEREWLHVMHLAEGRLSTVAPTNKWTQAEEYAFALDLITNNRRSISGFFIAHAREEQRREALLRTLNLWDT